MSTSSLRRRAAIAALATAGGLAVPLIAAAPASAAEPTGISVEAPADANVALNGPHTFVVDLSGTGTTATAQGVFYALTGPDQPTGSSNLDGHPCTLVTTSRYNCTITNGGQPGVDNITFFYDKNGTGTVASSDPTASGSLTIGGAVNSVSLVPTGAHVAQGQPQQYTVSAKDNQGRPVVDANLTVAATQAGATNGDLTVSTTKPSPVAPAAATTGSTATQSATVATGDGSNHVAAGAANVYVASAVSGTVNLSLNTSPASATISDQATLTVDPGGLNDVTTVTPNPGSVNAYNGKQVTLSAVLKNSQGDLVAGVTPTAVISGPNAGAAITSTASDANGVATVKYTATNAGTDTVTIFVNKTTPPPAGGTRTNGPDADEAKGNVTVTVAAEDIDQVNGQSTTVPAGELSASATFFVDRNTNHSLGAPGVGLTFSIPTADQANYSLSSTSGTTDSSGNATVTVTALNSAAANDGKHVTVTATVTQDTTKSGTATVTWQARAAVNVVITPFASTNPVGGTTSYSVSATDQFGTPVTNATFRWTVSGRNNPSNNSTASGTGSTFSYTDKGPSLTGTQVGDDQVTVTARIGANTEGSDTVNQYWVPGTAKAAQVNGDLSGNGEYVHNPSPNGPLVPSGFTKNENAGTTTDPTSGNTADVVPVEAVLTDANGNPLYGDQVTFSSSGVGGFTDAEGHPLSSSSSTTARVCDNSDAAGETFEACGGNSAVATVFVRSATPGTETITITADGIQDQVTVNYSGQYVPVDPTRVADTRTGQGAIATGGGADAPTTLVPNTTYYFDYSSAQAIPENQEAYAFNVTAINPTKQGNLRVAPECTGDDGESPNPAAPTTSLINYQPGKTTANFVIVPNDCGLRLYSDNSPVAVAIDLVGYYPTSDGITDITPNRIVDTRSGVGGAAGKVASGSSRSFQVGGSHGVPNSATAVALNVTAITPGGLGNLRIYPDGASVPTSSNINYIKGVTKAAFVIVNLPANGKIDVFSDGQPVDVAIDLYAYYPSTSTLVTQSPSRILDTRNTTELASGVARNVQVTGRAGVPADAQAVLVSITSIHAADSTGVGNLRAYPAGGSVPTVSTLNYVSKTADVANFAIVKIGTGGQITLYSDGSPINAAVDVLGYVPSGGNSSVPVNDAKHRAA